MSSPSALHLRNARKEEIPALVLLSEKAFRGRPLSDALFPEHLQTDPNERYEFRAQIHLRKFDNEDLYYIVVADEDDTAVGYAIWQSPPKPGTSFQDAGTTKAILAGAKPKFLDADVLATVEKGTAVLEKQIRDALGKEGYENAWYLDAIAVDPAHQRRGIGKMLMQWGQERADQEHRNVRFMASESGSRMYRALGYEELGSVDCYGGMESSFIKKAV